MSNTTPNLYDFLRTIFEAAKTSPKNHVFLTNGDLEWLEHFLRASDTELRFKSYFTGKLKLIEVEDPEVAQKYIEDGHHIDGKPAEPEISYDLGIAGKPVDVFTLLTEAMTLNPNFASVIIAAGRYYQEHVPHCPHCQEHHDPAAEHVDIAEITTWEFKKQ